LIAVYKHLTKIIQNTPILITVRLAEKFESNNKDNAEENGTTSAFSITVQVE